MLEMFVVLMCIGDYECGEALRAYSKTPAGKEHTKNIKDFGNKKIGKEQMAVIGTFYAAASNKKIKLRIAPGVTFEGNQDEAFIIYKYNF